MTADELRALAARVEQATGADRDLDAQIHRARGFPVESWHNGRWFMADNNAVSHPLPLYTASIDAALTLVPAGWKWWVNSMAYGRCWQIVGDRVTNTAQSAQCATPALALTAAALRARAEEAGEVRRAAREGGG